MSEALEGRGMEAWGGDVPWDALEGGPAAAGWHCGENWSFAEVEPDTIRGGTAYSKRSMRYSSMFEEDWIGNLTL